MFCDQGGSNGEEDYPREKVKPQRNNCSEEDGGSNQICIHTEGEQHGLSSGVQSSVSSRLLNCGPWSTEKMSPCVLFMVNTDKDQDMMGATPRTTDFCLWLYTLKNMWCVHDAGLEAFQEPEDVLSSCLSLLTRNISLAVSIKHTDSIIPFVLFI